HHFIQHKSIEEPYSVGDFETDALKELDLIFQEKEIAVMVGGSGLYIKSIVEGLDSFPEVDPKIRENLNEQLKNKGLEVIQEQLKLLDPDYYNAVDIYNPHRIIRAVEISMGTGKPYSSFLKNKKVQRPFKTITIGILAPREII